MGVATVLTLLAVQAATSKGEALPAAGAGSWHTHVAEDAMTGSKRNIALVEGPGGTLILKCDAPGKPLYVDFLSQQFLGGQGIERGIREFWYRFDEQAATETYFKYDDNDAWSFRKQDAAAFVDGIVSAKRVRVRAVTYRGQMVDAEFPMVGAPAALEEVRATCAEPGSAKRKTLGVHIG